MYGQKKNGDVIIGLQNTITNFTRENSDDFKRLSGLFLNLNPKESYFHGEIDECSNLIKGLEYEIAKWLKWASEFEVSDKQESFLVYLETKTFKDLLYNRLHYIKYIEKELETRKNEFYSLKKLEYEEDERNLRKLPKIEK